MQVIKNTSQISVIFSENVETFLSNEVSTIIIPPINLTGNYCQKYCYYDFDNWCNYGYCNLCCNKRCCFNFFKNLNRCFCSFCQYKFNNNNFIY